MPSFDPHAPEIHELLIERMDTPENSNAEIPSKVILLRPTPGDAANDLLFLDQVPIPKEAWSYDAHDKILRWRGAFGGGDLHFGHDHLGAIGVIGGDALQFVSVQAKSTVTFLCEVALHCGVAYITGRGGNIIGLHWDPTAPEWKNADWIKNRLLLTYSIDKSNPLAPPEFTFLFEDLQTKTLPWDPLPGDFTASLLPGEFEGRFVWDIDFRSLTPPPKDHDKPSSGPDTVLPYWMVAREPFAITGISGAMQIDDYAPQGRLAGFQGIRVMPMVAGYYQTTSEHAAFGLFGAHICLDGTPVHRCMVTEDALSWTDLSAHLQQKLGLPAGGVLTFDNTGGLGTSANGQLTIRRLDASEALQNIGTHQDLHTRIHAVAGIHRHRIDDAGPDMLGLLLMTPFKRNTDNAWGDEVQRKVLSDMSDIMNSFVPPDMWRRLFPGSPQPVLSGELARVANSPVPGVNNPIDWYRSLSTTVLTQGMAGGVNPNCQFMNGPRAEAWLRDEVANSKVYQAHSQLLFTYRWEGLNPTIQSYWQDQKNNAASHAGIINDQVVRSLLDIDLNVTTDAATPPDLISKLKAEVEMAGIYAKTNKLYWAFAFYIYNTQPAILGHIGHAIGIGGNSDGTVLTRMIQTNIAVLTALDPSGFFAKQYNTTINTFLATNILPSMYGFTGEADDFDLIREYIKKFVAQNINNPDKKIADATVQLQAIVDAENFEQLLSESIASLRSLSGFARTALALPQIASQWAEWFKVKYPRFSGAANFFGGALIGGMSIMATINLVKAYERWDDLDDARRAQIVLDTIQVGLQVFSAVVKRGVRIYAIFNVAGMTSMQRSAAVMTILATGKAGQLNTGLMAISNRTALWLGETAGAASMRQEVMMLMNIGSNDIVAVSWTAKVFGKNLNEFIGTRLGPLLTVAGMALSIYFIADGRSGVGLGVEILNIAAGALTLFAMVGGWLIQGGIFAAQGMMAGIIAIAGPLSLIVAAVGFGLMFWLMYQKPPDPVEKFLNDYVKPAGLSVASKCGSIDYVIPYKRNSENELMMLGFSLLFDRRVLTCQTGGAISLSSGSNLPECVWKVVTDGKGLSSIATLAPLKTGETPVGLLLSLMSDHTISFQPKMTNPDTDTGAKAGPTVLTQTWLTHTVGDATTANGNTALVSLPIKFQPVFPDGKGQYRPGQAMGWIVDQGDRFVYTAAGEGAVFTLRMEGLAPNYVSMPDLTFLLDSIPDPGQLYGPSFGLTPSAPIAFTEPVNLPTFLSFVKETGLIHPNGAKAKDQLKVQCILEMKNTLGAGRAVFNVSVEPAPVKPPTV